MGVDDKLTAKFDQGEILNLYRITDPNFKTTSADAGICQELAWKWMKRLNTKVAKYHSPELRMEALNKFETADKAVTHHNNYTPLTYVFSNYNIPRAAVKSHFHYDKNMLNSWALQGGGLYLSLKIPNRNDEKHAVAAFSRPVSRTEPNPPVFFFDPNHGEYKAPGSSAAFMKFLTDFFKEKYATEPLGNIMEMAHYGYSG